MLKVKEGMSETDVLSACVLSASLCLSMARLTKNINRIYICILLCCCGEIIIDKQSVILYMYECGGIGRIRPECATEESPE